MTDDGLSPLDSDAWNKDDQLAIAQVRYLMSLLLLPYVSKYLAQFGDSSAVVDDAAMRAYRTYQPGTPLDVAAFTERYIHDVEQKLARKRRVRVDLERVWTQHATEVREWLRQRLREIEQDDK